ncbi:hypothetical protein NOR51B_863 [Luminiphilus syltensis NOR5-1B]|uniref:Toluene tolerance protein n=1 Tax=Luminiphilus syltensis NOR5-1B TaxID=565045 RepID=B8KR79_9GAMM|nr:hypothetical protein NOR51B_863 [Luminiphilus syltensis NOR5-1B]
MIRGVVMLVGVSLAPLLVAEEMAAPGPGAVVKAATDHIMAAVAEAPEYFDTDPERYYAEVGAELDKVVDFRGFARGIMGSYASSERFRSLDKAGQENLRAQLDRFTGVVRDGLITTYSKGLLAFGGSDVELKDVELSPDSVRVASVTQLVRADDSRVYTLKYQMGQYRDGQWRLRNMIIENINLGEIYRGQFEAAVKAEDGDIDAVIDAWNTVAFDDAGEEA